MKIHYRYDSETNHVMCATLTKGWLKTSDPKLVTCQKCLARMRPDLRSA